MSRGSRGTSDSVVRLETEVDGFLESLGDIGSIDQLIENMLGQGQGVPDSLIEQADQLSKLMTASGDRSDELRSLRRDGGFDVSATKDEMLLCLSVRPPIAGGKPATSEAVLEWLKTRGIRQGVDLRAIRQAVEVGARGEEASEVLIVRGRAPKSGQPGRLDFFGRPTPSEPLQPIHTDATAAASSELRWVCQAADRIAQRVPPVEGSPGYDAWGRELAPPEPADVNLHAGRNVRTEGDSFFAQVSGMVSLPHGRLEVQELLVLVDDVTAKDGPIEFHGEIHIRAAVRSGAVIKTSGDIVINGAVEDATIESTEGNVLLKQGVAGRHRGLIRAKGNVQTRFAENATIQAGKDICIRSGAVRCQLAAGRSVILNQGRGQLLGGVTVAGHFVEAKCLGAASGVHTEVIVGLDHETMTQLGMIDADVARLESTRDEASELADRICRAIGDPLKLQPRKLHRYKELRRVQLAANLKLNLLRDQRKALLAQKAKVHSGEVRILCSALPNVVVSIGDATLKVQESLGPCLLSYDQKRRAIIQSGGRSSYRRSSRLTSRTNS